MFSTELILLIFQQFNSKRYLTECSIVCKQWYAIASDPLFYKTINLYTYNQLELFIHYAIHKKQKQQPIGYFVNYIRLLFDDTITEQTILKLQQCCPFVKEITFLIDITYLRRYFQLWSSWNYLEKLPVQFSIINDSDVTATLNTIQKVNNKENNSTLISLSLITGFQNSIIFKLFTTSILSSLQELNINFNFSRISLIYIDMIHTTCPYLKKLLMTKVIISDNHHNENNNNENDIQIKHQKWENINNLQFKHIIVEDTSFFIKLFYSYPNLESLFLEKILTDINVSNYLQHNNYRDFIGLDHLSKLKHLKFSFHHKNSLCEALPKINGLLQWLNNHPQQLSTLEIPINMVTSNITKPDLKTQNSPTIIYPSKNRHRSLLMLYPIETLKPFFHFIKYINTLILSVPYQTSFPSSYLNINNNTNNQLISTCLKSLTIYRATDERPLYIEFNLFDWLILFPSLTSVKLTRISLVSDTSLLKYNNKINNDQYQHTQLKEIILIESIIKMKSGLNYLCQQCPRLEILHIDCTNTFYYPSLSINNVDEKHITIHHHPNIIMLYAPNHSFKEIVFTSNICFPLNPCNRYRFKDFILYTSKLSVTMCDKYFIDHVNYGEKMHMCMIMDSVDRFRLNDTWIVY